VLYPRFSSGNVNLRAGLQFIPLLYQAAVFLLLASVFNVSDSPSDNEVFRQNTAREERNSGADSLHILHPGMLPLKAKKGTLT